MANCIRFLAMDAVQKANSGHPGMPMGMADIATILFKDFLKFDPNDVSIRIVTKQESSVPTTRLRFLKRDDTSYYVSTYTSPTVYILDNTVTENLIKTSQDLLTGTNQ